MKKQINVILVDDHKVILDGIEEILKREERINVVGKAIDVGMLMHILKNKEVDLIIMDVQMPKIDGLEASKLAKREYPNVKIIILTAFSNNRLHFSKAKDYGVNGYMAKSKDRYSIVKAIYKVMDENQFVTDGIDDDIKSIRGSLTTNELEIVKMICEEASNPDIAEQMKCSVRTVERQRKNIYRKVGVVGAVGLVRYAVEHNLI
ncbi:MAG: response regulator transcription factor [Bacteroidota bacterium]